MLNYDNEFYGRLIFSFLSITATTCLSLLFLGHNNPNPSSTAKIGNVNMPVSNQLSGIVNLEPIIDTSQVTSFICNCFGNGVRVTGGGDLSGCAFPDIGFYYNGVYTIKSFIRNNNNTANSFSLVNAIIKSSFTGLIKTNPAGVFDYAGANIFSVYGLCKIINTNASGTLPLFDTLFSNKTNIGILIHGQLQLERYTHLTNVGSVVVNNGTTITI